MQGIISPKTILERKIVVAAPGFPDINQSGPHNQVQQVGIDLRLAKVSMAMGPTEFMLDDALTIKPTIMEVPVQEGGVYFLTEGKQYLLDFMEDVDVPGDMAALVVHRSTINRFAGTVMSGWYDPGFRSKGGCGAIFRPARSLKVQVGYRMAQVVFFSAESASLYDGQYQARDK